MDKKFWEDFSRAYKRENDHRAVKRMTAVRDIPVHGMLTVDVAGFHGVTPNTVRSWVERLERGGLGGLRDPPDPAGRQRSPGRDASR